MRAFAPTKNKYSNQKVIVGGIQFSSIKESSRYLELLLLQRAKKITDLELQPVFVIAESVVLDGRRKAQRKYIADFRYKDLETGQTVVEDVKGMKTAEYKLKRHLVMAVHGIEVKEL